MGQRSWYLVAIVVLVLAVACVTVVSADVTVRVTAADSISGELLTGYKFKFWIPGEGFPTFETPHTFTVPVEQEYYINDAVDGAKQTIGNINYCTYNAVIDAGAMLPGGAELHEIPQIKDGDVIDYVIPAMPEGKLIVDSSPQGASINGHDSFTTPNTIEFCGRPDQKILVKLTLDGYEDAEQQVEVHPLYAGSSYLGPSEVFFNLVPAQAGSPGTVEIAMAWDDRHEPFCQGCIKIGIDNMPPVLRPMITHPVKMPLSPGVHTLNVPDQPGDLSGKMYIGMNQTFTIRSGHTTYLTASLYPAPDPTVAAGSVRVSGAVDEKGNRFPDKDVSWSIDNVNNHPDPHPFNVVPMTRTGLSQGSHMIYVHAYSEDRSYMSAPLPVTVYENQVTDLGDVIVYPGTDVAGSAGGSVHVEGFVDEKENPLPGIKWGIDQIGNLGSPQTITGISAGVHTIDVPEQLCSNGQICKSQQLTITVTENQVTYMGFIKLSTDSSGNPSTSSPANPQSDGVLGMLGNFVTSVLAQVGLAQSSPAAGSIKEGLPVAEIPSSGISSVEKSVSRNTADITIPGDQLSKNDVVNKDPEQQSVGAVILDSGIQNDTTALSRSSDASIGVLMPETVNNSRIVEPERQSQIQNFEKEPDTGTIIRDNTRDSVSVPEKNTGSAQTGILKVTTTVAQQKILKSTPQVVKVNATQTVVTVNTTQQVLVRKPVQPVVQRK
ncbi:MAG: hypothetical protein A4E35_00547 [Methanoregula sp. PtaU1.Bin051]|nr:MAG: hypothetical protein A4E35_00547 [Methanoregula sp. PtaU1.Bin051]